MQTWTNWVSAFAMDPDCQRLSALAVAWLVSALVVYAVLWLVARTVIATVNVGACWMLALRYRLPRSEWACSPGQLWRWSWQHVSLRHMVDNIAAVVA